MGDFSCERGASRRLLIGDFTIMLLMASKAWLWLTEVEMCEEAEETRGKDRNYEEDTEGDDKLP